MLNYETFQQKEKSESFISKLIKNNRIDYIILDEVQNVKQRKEDRNEDDDQLKKNQSLRRTIVNKLIIHSRLNNENLLLMVMSANRQLMK